MLLYKKVIKACNVVYDVGKVYVIYNNDNGRINKSFKAPEDCCKNECSKYDKSNCNFNEKKFKLNYYCNI